MPSGNQDFRPVCGRFAIIFDIFMLKRAKQKAAMTVKTCNPRTRTNGVILGLVLTYLFWGGILLQCGDVELNPGPPKQDTMRQTRLNTGAERSESAQNKPAEPTLVDVMGVLQTLNNKFDEMKCDVQDLRNSNVALQEEIHGLRGEVTDLRQENDDLHACNSMLEERVREMETKMDDLENRSKRNNLIFHGLSRSENETNEDCEAMLKEFITDKLELGDDIVFDRVHRLSNKPDSPVITRCAFFKDKVTILKAKRKLQGSQISIGEDFSQRVREMRRNLVPFLKKARSEQKRASLAFDHLYIDGKKYTYDSERKALAEVR